MKNSQWFSIPDLLDFKRFARERELDRQASAFEWTKDLWTVWFAEAYPEGIASPNALHMPEAEEGSRVQSSASTIIDAVR